MFGKTVQRAVAFASILSLMITATTFAADLNTEALLGTDAAPTTVEAGANNAFDIEVWLTGNLQDSHAGQATIVTKYFMAADGTITPSTLASDKIVINFVKPFHYTQNCVGTTQQQGCAANPFVVGATIAVAATAAPDTSGTLVIAGAGSSGVAAPPASFDSGTVAVEAPADSTAPTITPTITGTQGSNGWYTSNVTVTFTVTDDESAITSRSAHCDATNSVTTDTAGVTFTCTAESTGGEATSSVTIKRDATAPSVVYTSASGTAGANDWYKSDVIATFTATDNLSGFGTATPASLTTTGTNTASGEGSAVSVGSPAFTDNAGNTAAAGAASKSFKIDKTAPTAELSIVSGTGDAGANGWLISDATVRTSGSDALSGVTCTADQALNVETTGQTFNGSCTDGAGWTTNASSLSLKLDKTGPSAALQVSAGTLGSGGWYTTNVTVTTSGSDSISNPTVCTAAQQFTADTPSTTVNGKCTNDAGIETNATAITIKIDQTHPDVSVTGVANGATYTLGSVPTAGCTTTDALSGVATHATLSAPAGGPVGSITVSCTGAVDNAGNMWSASATYNVVYNWSGFFRPVDNLPTLNVAKAGSSIPLKFSLGGDQGLAVLSGAPTIRQITCDTNLPTDLIEEYATATTANNGLTYDAAADQYNYVWKTDKIWAGKCFQLTMRLIDGTQHVANFKLTK